MEYALNRIIIGEKVMVRYLLKQKGGNVAGKTAYESAMWMLKDGAKKHGGVRLSDEFEGYPLTADGVYFFDGIMEMDEGEDEGATSSEMSQAAGHLPRREASPLGLKGKALGETDTEGEGSGEAELGADGLPIPAGTGAGKARRKKRMKDVVCE